jgi:Zn-dependent peptidase ImmA (M78 family)
MIYIIECKDYRNRVPVSKIEAFHDEIRQVSGVNVKGIFISNSPLQEGAFNIADSVGMMVIQGESSDDYKIILHKINRDGSVNRIPFIKDTFIPELINNGVEVIEQIVDKVLLGLFEENIDDSKVSYGIDRLSKIDIEEIARQELNKINPFIILRAHSLSPKTLISYMQNEFNIEIRYFESNENILGACEIEKKKIGINQSIKGSNRELFIMAHEFGHFVLHQKLSIGQTLYNSFEDSDFNFKTNKYDLRNPKQWLEWQANYFASSLIVAKAPFEATLSFCQRYLNLRQGRIYIDDQECTRSAYNAIVRRMAYSLNVSPTTIIYKLEELKLVDNRSHLKSIGQLIGEFLEGYYT